MPSDADIRALWERRVSGADVRLDAPTCGPHTLTISDQDAALLIKADGTQRAWIPENREGGEGHRARSNAILVTVLMCLLGDMEELCRLEHKYLGSD